MLHHISIAVENPPHVAKVLAELWQSRALPFPLYPDCYVVFPGDQHGTAIEVYPLGRELVPDNPELPELQPVPITSRYTATHAAVCVLLELMTPEMTQRLFVNDV